MSLCELIMLSKTGSRRAELREALLPARAGGERRGERGGRGGASLIPRPIRRFCRSRAGSEGALKLPLPPPPTGLSGEQLLQVEEGASESAKRSVQE
jgi:hypothetical protein